MADPPILHSARFTLRPLQEGDEQALFPAFSDPELMRYWSRAPFTDREALRAYLFDARGGGRTWIAVPAAGGGPVMRLYVSQAAEQVAEIGYILTPGHARQGIARECLGALLPHLFRAEGFHRVFADTDPANIPSNRLLERLGFTREAHLRQAMRTHLGWRDTWLWGLLADEWPD